jgi:hypothetical protein
VAVSKDSTGGGALSGSGSVWTQQQQKQLEKGLIAFPAADNPDAKERWTKIASTVDGKSPKVGNILGLPTRQ